MPDSLAVRVYLLHPPEAAFPGVAETIQRVRETVQAQGISVATVEMDRSLGFHAQRLAQQALSNPGPVVLLRPVQHAALADLRGRLEGRRLIAESAGLADLERAIFAAAESHRSDEPTVSTKLLMALWIIAVLKRDNHWCGNNDKGYRWTNALLKGFDPADKGAAGEVLEDLRREGVLLVKYGDGKGGGSKDGQKFGLNPAHRALIDSFLQRHRFVGVLTRVNRFLLDDRRHGRRTRSRLDDLAVHVEERFA